MFKLILSSVLVFALSYIIFNAYDSYINNLNKSNDNEKTNDNQKQEFSYEETESEPQSTEDTIPYLFNISVNDITGITKKLKEYTQNKKAILFVNVASECGYTDNNYKELQIMYNMYSKKGLQILAFPCNQFGNQENKQETWIKNFVESKYKIDFPMFSKINVNGEDTHEVYKYLKLKAGNKLKNGNIEWNFAKFLVNNKGELVEFFSTQISPNKILPAIKNLLRS